MWLILEVWQYYIIAGSSHAYRCDMAFIEPMHCNKPNITYLLHMLIIMQCIPRDMHMICILLSRVVADFTHIRQGYFTGTGQSYDCPSAKNHKIPPPPPPPQIVINYPTQCKTKQCAYSMDNLQLQHINVGDFINVVDFFPHSSLCSWYWWYGDLMAN